MIRSATAKLTLWYLAIIMALSIGFSFFLYRLSTAELNRGLRRQNSFFAQPRPGFPTLPPSFENFRVKQLEEGRQHLLDDLVIFNLTTLLLGGAASYALARRTLHPIEDALEAQSRFTADASHELRTPLTAMQTEIEVALRNTSLNKQQAKNLLKSNLEEVAKLKALSDALLRLASQNGHDGSSQANIESAIDQALARVEQQAKARSITINPSASPLVVAGDENSLSELLVILLDNAIKYSQPASKITVSAERHGKFAHLTVTDKGHGIKASDLPHIFDRFYRSDPSRSKDKIEGYGLGLSIAQKIVDLHNGSIEVKSTAGKGSQFTVKLPLAEV